MAGANRHRFGVNFTNTISQLTYPVLHENRGDASRSQITDGPAAQVSVSQVLSNSLTSQRLP